MLSMHGAQQAQVRAGGCLGRTGASCCDRLQHVALFLAQAPTCVARRVCSGGGCDTQVSIGARDCSVQWALPS